MSTYDKLNAVEDRLDSIVTELENEEFERARADAVGISNILDCPMCQQLENGILGGVLYAAGMTPPNRDERTEQVIAEIERFRDEELAEAKELLDEEPESVPIESL